MAGKERMQFDFTKDQIANAVHPLARIAFASWTMYM